MIWTSSFYLLNKLPDCMIPIAICGQSPEWYTGAEYKKLAPTKSIYYEWKEVYDNTPKDNPEEYVKRCLEADKLYTKRFREERLKKLNVNDVVYDLFSLSNKKQPCLICYEKHPLEFCHRHLVAIWLTVNEYNTHEWTGYECNK